MEKVQTQFEKWEQIENDHREKVEQLKAKSQRLHREMEIQKEETGNYDTQLLKYILDVAAEIIDEWQRVERAWEEKVKYI